MKKVMYPVKPKKLEKMIEKSEKWRYLLIPAENEKVLRVFRKREDARKVSERLRRKKGSVYYIADLFFYKQYAETYARLRKNYKE